MAFHAGAPHFESGFIGVDIFFVISGYLIIGQLDREYSTNQRIQLARFLGRRARRLVPAATLVLLATMVASYVLMSRMEAGRNFVDAIFAAFYVANLHFGSTATNYWAAGTTSSVIHYWSLGVEEQFYVLFPLLFIAAATLLHRTRSRYLFPVLLTIVSAGSFGLMLFHEHVGSTWTFYGTLDRAWEFAIGGLVATWFDRRPARGRWWALALGVVALADIGWFIMYNDPTADFPNWNAVPPVVAIAYLIWLGADDSFSKLGLMRPYRLRPVQAIGRWSYSLYLWHWPVLAFGVLILQGPLVAPTNTSISSSGVLVPAAVALAAVSTRFVEQPIRNHPKLISSPKRSLLVGITMSSIVSLIAVGLAAVPKALNNTPIYDMSKLTTVTSNINSPEVSALIARTTPSDVSIDQSIVTYAMLRGTAADIPPTNDVCHLNGDEKINLANCTWGAASAHLKVVLFGNSHANQFFAPLQGATLALNGQFTSLTRSQCPVADVVYIKDGKPWDQCNKWREEAMKDILQIKPTYVFIVMTGLAVQDPITGKPADPKRTGELRTEGIRKTVHTLTSAGIHVVMVRNTPFLRQEPLDCLSAHTLEACAAPTVSTLLSDGGDTGAVVGMSGVSRVDLTQLMCGPQTCPMSRGGVLVWRDTHHITNTYAKQLTQFFAEYLVLLNQSK